MLPILNTIIAVGLFCGLIQYIILFYELKIKRMAKGGESLPPVTILKPLKGMDNQLEENLRSFFELKYQNFEIIFGVQDRHDPACALIQALQSLYPEVKTRLVIDDREIGLNPKVNTLHNILPTAKYEHVLISDSNVRVEPDYLTHLVSYFISGNFGLVTSMIRGLGAGKMGSVLENLHLNSTVAGTVMVFDRVFRKPVCIGKSLLVRKSIISAIGGVASFRNVLAEDYYMGVAVKSLGLRAATSSYWVDNVVENWNLEDFVSRHSRWAKMRLHCSRLTYTGELLGNPIVNAAIFFLLWPDIFKASFLFATIIVKLVIDCLILRLMRSDLRLRHVLLIPFKDMMIFIIWFLPFVSRRIVWRGNHMRISKNTYLQHV